MNTNYKDISDILNGGVLSSSKKNIGASAYRKECGYDACSKSAISSLRSCKSVINSDFLRGRL